MVTPSHAGSEPSPPYSALGYSLQLLLIPLCRQQKLGAVFAYGVIVPRIGAVAEAVPMVSGEVGHRGAGVKDDQHCITEPHSAGLDVYSSKHCSRKSVTDVASHGMLRLLTSSPLTHVRRNKLRR